MLPLGLRRLFVFSQTSSIYSKKTSSTWLRQKKTPWQARKWLYPVLMAPKEDSKVPSQWRYWKHPPQQILRFAAETEASPKPYRPPKGPQEHPPVRRQKITAPGVLVSLQ